MLASPVRAGPAPVQAGVNLNVIDNYGYTVADRAADTTRLGSETDLIAKKEEALKLILKVREGTM